MYPTFVTIGSFEVTTFGVMMAAAVVAGMWLFARELRFSRLPERAINGAMLAVAAGLVGAKLLFVAEHTGEAPVATLLSSRGGLSWFGGLAAGVGTALGYFRWHRLPVLRVVSAAVASLTLGHMLGRIGCFLVGDDYGSPTNLPWAVAFPYGLPPTTVRVHPTQLYEAAFLGVFTLVLLHWRRARVADRIIVGRYLCITGSARFLIEFLRINPPVLFGLTVAQCAGLATCLVGLVIWNARMGQM